MICFCYFCKKMVFRFGRGAYTSWTQKIAILRDFTIFFRTNYWISIKVINVNWIPWLTYILLETSKNNTKRVWSCGKIGPYYVLGPMLWYVKKVPKENKLSIGFSHILQGKYILKHKVVVVQTWKTLGPNFCSTWVKNGRKVIIFKNFTLVNLKFTKLIII